MPHGSLEEEKLRSTLHIIQRIFQDAWLIEERSILIRIFQEQFSCSEKELEDFFAQFFHPKNLSSISLRAEQAQQKRFSLQERVQPNLLFFRDVIRLHGAIFVLQIVDIVIALLLEKGKDWEDILHSFSQLVQLGVEPLLVMALYQRSNLMHTKNLLKDILYGKTYLTIGRSPVCDIVLLDPLVQELHASLSKEGGQWMIRSESEHRPVWANGKPVRSYPLEEKDSVYIGPIELRMEGLSIFLHSHRQLSVLSVNELQRKIGMIPLLEDISFRVFSGEVIALVGPSGAGKTTLLNAINATAPADSGQVLFDGRDFHRQLSLDRSLIGIVPQDDLVLPELTVEESLYYSGRLRLPISSTVEDIQKEVERVLEELDIVHIRNQRIGDAINRGISGGQRKRVNLGQELISRSTQILFLDEPTSGLDPRASQDIVRLARALADRGRIVFLVTHDLTDQIMKQVDNLLVLERGGKLAFFGSEEIAQRFFQVDSTDQMFRKLGSDDSTWPEKYKETPLFGIREQATASFSSEKSTPVITKSPEIRVFFRHVQTLFSRYLKVKMRDRMGVLVTLLQPMFRVMVMSLVFRHQGDNGTDFVPTQTMIFMMSLACMWFGMSAAVRELITDQVIFVRERRIGVGIFPYILSKTLVLGLMTCLQVVLMSGTLYWIFSLGEYGFTVQALCYVSTITAWLGMSVGLCVSSLWKSSEAAVGTIPLILIPQIAFSTIMYGLRDMTPLAKFCSGLIFQRYTFDAFLKSGEEVAARSYQGDFVHQPLSGTLWKLGLKTTDKASDMGLPLETLTLIISGMTLILLCLSIFFLWARGRKIS
jgi:ABC-type multidrug transport system ATPase subunit